MSIKRRLLSYIIQKYSSLSKYFVSKNSYIAILTYHNIEKKNSNFIDRYSFTPEEFESHCKFLSVNNFISKKVNDINSIINQIEGNKFVIITFDDGYLSNYKYAINILKKYKLTATFFIDTSRIGQTDHLEKRHILEINKLGFEIGSHSHTHKNLAMLDDKSLKNELLLSKSILNNITGKEILSFSYPYGQKRTYSEETKSNLINAGYRYACTQNGRIIKDDKVDYYQIPRFGLSDIDNFEVFKSKVNGNFDIISKLLNAQYVLKKKKFIE